MRSSVGMYLHLGVGRYCMTSFDLLELVLEAKVVVGDTGTDLPVDIPRDTPS